MDFSHARIGNTEVRMLRRESDFRQLGFMVVITNPKNHKHKATCDIEIVDPRKLVHIIEVSAGAAAEYLCDKFAAPLTPEQCAVDAVKCFAEETKRVKSANTDYLPGMLTSIKPFFLKLNPSEKNRYMIYAAIHKNGEYLTLWEVRDLFKIMQSCQGLKK